MYPLLDIHIRSKELVHISAATRRGLCCVVLMLKLARLSQEKENEHLVFWTVHIYIFTLFFEKRPCEDECVSLKFHARPGIV